MFGVGSLRVSVLYVHAEDGRAGSSESCGTLEPLDILTHTRIRPVGRDVTLSDNLVDVLVLGWQQQGVGDLSYQ